ncbi:MAG: nucleotidyltransferase [Bacillota bacterium]
MKVLGIVAEYNPFHNGHFFHLQEAKKKINPDGTVCILSSCFLQRGEPAFVDKWARAKMALAGGVDLVLELPQVFACRSAFWFAQGSVKSLTASGVVTHLAFGAETNNLNQHIQIARFLNKEDFIFNRHLKKNLALGYSFPKARSRSLGEISNDGEDIADLGMLNNPNNILAIAYLRVLDLLDTPILPLIIKRIGSYHSELPEDGFASATAVRKMILKGDNRWIDFVPPTTREILLEEFAQGKGPVTIDRYQQSIISTIRRKDITSLEKIIEINNGLESRLWQSAQNTGNIHELLNYLKTKRYTYTKLQRMLIHVLLNFTNNLSSNEPSYLRILGFNSKGKEILGLMKEKTKIPVITKFADGFEKVSPQGRDILDFEARATDLYVLGFTNNLHQKGRQDFYRTPIVL